MTLVELKRQSMCLTMSLSPVLPSTTNLLPLVANFSVAFMALVTTTMTTTANNDDNNSGNNTNVNHDNNNIDDINDNDYHDSR